MATMNEDTGPTEPAAMSELRAAIVSELKKLEEDILWTEKAHFARAEELSRTGLWIGVVATIAATVSAAAIVARISPVIPGVFALLAALASGLLTFLKPSEAEKRHLDAGRRLGSLRVRVRQAIKLDSSLVLTKNPAELRALSGRFAEEKSKIDADSPGKSNRSFKAARRKIESRHFQHDSDPSN